MYAKIIHNDDNRKYFLKNQQIISNSLGNGRECRIQGWWYRMLVDAKVYEVRKWMIANDITLDSEGTLSQDSKDAIKGYIKETWKIRI